MPMWGEGPHFDEDQLSSRKKNEEIILKISFNKKSNENLNLNFWGKSIEIVDKIQNS